MPALIDLTGQRFGRLVVLERAENSKCGRARWVCRCDCGTTTTPEGGDLRSGHTQSCGCLMRERSTTHGLYGHALYRTWQDMIHRCTNPKVAHYFRYGGRGIYVCARWTEPDGQGLRNFIHDIEARLGPKPGPEYSIDRIHNNGPYAPYNVRWATRAQQRANQRSSAISQAA